jgi:hypothetical protein
MANHGSGNADMLVIFGITGGRGWPMRADTMTKAGRIGG